MALPHSVLLKGLLRSEAPGAELEVRIPVQIVYGGIALRRREGQQDRARGEPSKLE